MIQDSQQADMFSDFQTEQTDSDAYVTNLPPMATDEWLKAYFGIEEDTDLPDGTARFKGVHPHHSYIVQAPAGSGKTSLLSQRFLALLAQVESPEQIVAMTFTKKAAAEMRERIIKALAAANESLPIDASLVDINTQKLAQKALTRDAEKGWSLLQNPNRLRIKTIDGLNSYLVGQMPFLSKIGGQPQLVQDPTNIYQEAVRQVLKLPQLEEPVGRLLRLVNGRFARAENLLMSMLAKRDQWMRTLIKYQDDDARDKLQLAIEEIVSKSLTQHKEALYYLNDSFAEICDLTDYAVSNGQEQLQCLSGAWPLSDSLDVLPKWRALATWILTSDNKKIRATANKNIGFPAGKGEAKENKDRFVEALQSISQAAAADAQVLEAIIALKGLPEALYSDQQWQDLQWLIQILKMCVASLKLTFQQHAQADYIEIAQAASSALGTELEPTELAQLLDYQIQHLLVDEFQDTSSEQYRLLTQLIAGWQSDDGRTLFLVGDPMQSIYRFREAEVGNFLKAWQGQVGNVELKPLNLSVNFRSTAGVVNWVNEAFAKVLPKENDIEKGAVRYTLSKSFSTEENHAVHPHWAINQSSDEEAQEVLEVIKQRLNAFAEKEQACMLAGKPYKPQKIAILGRSRSSLTTIAQYLKEQKIGFRAVELENLSERQEVQDLLALTRALMHLSDKAAWIALLRSPLVGLNLIDLTVLIGDKPYQTAWSAIEGYKKEQSKVWAFTEEEGFSKEAVFRLNSTIPILENALQKLGSMHFATLLRETWIQLDGPQTVENPLALENVEVFCHALAEADAPIVNLQQLEQQMDKLFARPDSSEDSQKIELMTMHKSKGLEFDTVILPGLGRQPRGDDSELVSWFQFMSDEGEEQLVIAPIDQKGKSVSLLRQLLKGFEKEKQNFELARLFYVAATRAKVELHLFGEIKYQPNEKQMEKGLTPITPKKGSLLESLWSYVKPAFTELASEYEPQIEEQQQAETFIPKVSRLPLNRVGFATYKPEPLVQISTQPTNEITSALVFDEDDEDYLVVERGIASTELVFSQKDALLKTSVGNLVHAIFEQMVSETLNDWNSDRLEQRLPIYENWLLQQGLSTSQMGEALRRVKVSVTNALNNEKFKWAVLNSHKESATEYPLTSLEGDAVANHIVDRTFVDEAGVRWIIDYKTSTSDQDDVSGFIEKQILKYHPQLARYGHLFDQIEGRSQKWVLYFSYLDRWVEVQ